MATISRAKGKSGKVVYRVRVRVKGQSTQTATLASLAEAREWATKAEAEIYTQRYFPERIDSSHTLSEAIERYLREVLPYKRPNTIIGQTQRLYWWKDRLGAYKLTELTPDKINSCLDTLASKHSAYTVNAYLSSLSRLLTVAVKNWNWLSLNPTVKIRRLPQPRGRAHT